MVTAYRSLSALVVLGLLIGCDNSTATSISEQPAAIESTDVAAETKTMHTVTIVANVPADAPVIYASGNHPALGSWHPKGLEIPGTGATRTVDVALPKGHGLQFKLTAGSWEREGRGTEGAVLPNFGALVLKDMAFTAEIDNFRSDPRELIASWQDSGVEGTLVYWLDVPSAHLKETRHVVTGLPPSYDENKTYKVIYMHDGQNLFDPRLAYTDIDWGVDEAMLQGVRAGKYEPAIVVGIWNTADRLIEYSPAHLAPQYARFILEELKPRVEKTFSVKTGAANTFSMGASMGGVMSLYLVQNHPEVFGGCGCVSSHFTWSPRQLAWYRGENFATADPHMYIVKAIEDGAVMPTGARLYFDYGTEGFDADYEEPTFVVRDWLLAQGYTEGVDLKVQEFAGADHTDGWWRLRVGEQLEWLLGK